MTGGKRQYPWRLGATSFVVPADMTENVRLLAPLVDDVQLLFFESAAKSALSHPLEISELIRLRQEHALSYTAHLPLDIRLGSDRRDEREAGIAEICRLVEELSPLIPLSYDLHLLREDELPLERWLDNLARGLQSLAESLGAEKKMVAVENIDYPYGLVAPLVAENGFSHCLDWGHLLRYGHDGQEALAMLPQTRHLHYHGVQGERDHQALRDPAEAALLAEALIAADFQGVVTLELYSLERLSASLALLVEAWLPFMKQ